MNIYKVSRIFSNNECKQSFTNVFVFQEEDKGKRSRNPSFSNNAQHPGNKGRRSRTASEGDQVVQSNNSYQGRHSTGGKPNRGRANSGGSKPVRVQSGSSSQNQKRTKSNSECSAASIEKWKSIQKILYDFSIAMQKIEWIFFSSFLITDFFSYIVRGAALVLK